MQDYLKYQFITNDDGTGTLFCYTLEERLARIPATVAGFKMTAIGRWAFYYRGDCRDRVPLEQVEFEEGYTEVYHGAFFGCGNLKRILLPSTIEKIYGDPFVGCDALEDISFPNGNNRFTFENGVLKDSAGKVYFERKARI